MLKQYRAAVIGVICMIAAIVVTSLISLKDEQPTDTQPVIMAEQDMTADKEPKVGQPLLTVTGDMAETQPQGITVGEEMGLQETMETQPESMETEPATDQAETIEDGDLPETSTEDKEPVQVAEEVSDFDGYVLPVVDVYLNIRDVPSTEGTVVGKLYVGSKAKIVEQDGEWTKISSGTVEGYVNNEYIVTGKEAEELAKQDGRMIATVLENGINVRENPGLDADVLNIAGEGEQFEVADETEGWVAIRYSENIMAYMSADYVSVDFMLGEAISIEEEREAIRKAEEEAARKAAEQAAEQEKARQRAMERLENSQSVETVITDGYAASYDDTYLLACLVHMEAGAEPYEGKLAVANVVLNRVKAGYGSTISEVIYAKNQFTGANSGALASRLAKGPNDECLQAAVEALSGVNNIGDYRNFIAIGWANYDSYSAYTIIGHHCFYKR